MIRNKLYDELEKEGYYFHRLGSQGALVPKVFSLTDLDDWALVNTSITINGQYQVERGTNCSQKTIQLLQRVVEETSTPYYYDFISKNCLEDGE